MCFCNLFCGFFRHRQKQLSVNTKYRINLFKIHLQINDDDAKLIHVLMKKYNCETPEELLKKLEESFVDLNDYHETIQSLIALTKYYIELQKNYSCNIL